MRDKLRDFGEDMEYWDCSPPLILNLPSTFFVKFQIKTGRTFFALQNLAVNHLNNRAIDIRPPRRYVGALYFTYLY